MYDFTTTTSQGFSLTKNSTNNRIYNIIFTDNIVAQFVEQTAHIPVQDTEYRAFMRYRVASILDDLCSSTLRSLLIDILADRHSGCVTITPSGLNKYEQAEQMILFSTAITHLTGASSFDDMAKKYYARFVVEHQDNSDSYLRQAYRTMELHNDGTYVDEETDYLLMLKIDEQHVTGGESLLLHLDDWQEMPTFAADALAQHPFRWRPPASKNVHFDLYHPVFDHDVHGHYITSFIDQFIYPDTLEQGKWLYDLSQSIEASANISQHPSAPGQMIFLNNHYWLHGRSAFQPHPQLRRELCRQRGRLTSKPTLPYTRRERWKKVYA